MKLCATCGQVPVAKDKKSCESCLKKARNKNVKKRYGKRKYKRTAKSPYHRVKHLLRHAKDKKRYEFDITIDDLKIPTHCPVLGIELTYLILGSDIPRQPLLSAPSIDRFDSNKGYIKGNVNIISWRANKIKNFGTAAEHRQIADWMDSNATI